MITDIIRRCVCSYAELYAELNERFIVKINKFNRVLLPDQQTFRFGWEQRARPMGSTKSSVHEVIPTELLSVEIGFCDLFDVSKKKTQRNSPKTKTTKNKTNKTKT